MRDSNNDHQSQLIFSRMNIAPTCPTARNERMHNRKPDKSEIRESQALITHHNSSLETQSETPNNRRDKRMKAASLVCANFLNWLTLIN